MSAQIQSPAEEPTSVYQVTVDFEVVANSPEEAHQYISEKLGFSDPRISMMDIIPGQCPLEDGEDDQWNGGPEPIGSYLETME